MTAELRLVRLMSGETMKVIGLTGGIGSGKSTVSRFLRELGAVVIDTDALWHEALEPGKDVWRQVVAVFGEGILGPDREIDRRKLGAIVFGDARARDRLDRIMHPWMYEAVRARLEEYRRQGVAVVVLEIPLLVEVPLYMRAHQPSLTDEVDEVWVTVALEATVIRRLEEKGLAREEALARIRSQISSEERLKHADVVIDTDCSLEELRTRVRELWAKLEA